MATDAQRELTSRPTRSGLKVLAVGLMGLVLLLGLYVASVGPAAHVLGWETWVDVYGPLVWAAERWEWASWLLWSYMEKCGPEMPAPPAA